MKKQVRKIAHVHRTLRESALRISRLESAVTDVGMIQSVGYFCTMEMQRNYAYFLKNLQIVRQQLYECRYDRRRMRATARLEPFRVALLTLA